MPNWNAPSELNGQKPRPVRMQARYRFLMFFTNIVLVAPFIFIGGLMADNIHKMGILKDRGVDTIAIVTDLHTEKGRSKTNYLVSYEYTPNASGVAISGHLAIAQGDYIRLRIGTEMPITYDPIDTALSRPNFLGLIHQTDPITSTFESNKPVAYVCGIWIVAIFAISGIGFWTYLKQRHLLQWGDAAPVTILGEQEYRVRGGRFSKVRYSFRDAHAKIVEGFNSYVPVAGDSRPRFAEFRAEILRNQTVLFDPNDSSKNVLYPPSTVELIRD